MTERVRPDQVWWIDVLPSGLRYSFWIWMLTRSTSFPSRQGISPRTIELALAGWTLLHRTTSIDIDGPADLGFLVQQNDLEASSAWADAASRHGGALVFFRSSSAVSAEQEARMRGGFVRLIASP